MLKTVHIFTLELVTSAILYMLIAQLPILTLCQWLVSDYLCFDFWVIHLFSYLM